MEYLTVNFGASIRFRSNPTEANNDTSLNSTFTTTITTRNEIYSRVEVDFEVRMAHEVHQSDLLDNTSRALNKETLISAILERELIESYLKESRIDAIVQ